LEGEEMTSPQVFTIHYADKRQSVVLEADLDKGWGIRKKTYGFFRSAWVPYKDDLKIRAQLALIAQPATFSEWATDFPPIELDLGNDSLSYHLRDKKFSVKVSLTANQQWRTTPEGRPEIFIAETPLLKLDENRWFDLRTWIVFHEPSRPPIKDVRVWVENRLVLPGGQFESQRRRH
jgi:hypothetical protein